MTAGQIRKLLDRAGLSQRGAAKALEINERTMRKYVSGDSKIPKTVELALLYLAANVDHNNAMQAAKLLRQGLSKIVKEQERLLLEVLKHAGPIRVFLSDQWINDAMDICGLEGSTVQRRDDHG